MNYSTVGDEASARGLVGRLRPRVRRGRLALMLTAYADESACTAPDGRRFLLMAGYLTDRESWSHFGRAWRPFLRRFGLKWFHAVDVNNRFRDEKNRKSLMDASSGQWDEAKRDACFDAAACIVKRHVDTGVSCAIDLDQFEALARDARVEEPWTDPYYIAYYWALNAAVEVRQRYCFPAAWKMDVIFDSQEEHQANALRVFQPWGDSLEEVGRIDHEDDRTQVCLQAADMLAWTHQLRVRQAKYAMDRRFEKLGGRYILAEVVEGPRLYSFFNGAMHSILIDQARRS